MICKMPAPLSHRACMDAHAEFTALLLPDDLFLGSEIIGALFSKLPDCFLLYGTFPAMLPIGTFVLMAGQNVIQSSIIADKTVDRRRFKWRYGRLTDVSCPNTEEPQ